ncbi:MAG: OmpA family protein [Rhodobacteraceae bacterium]|nr:OmpA family protein [Paracoccaceae bacterium]
MRSKTALMAGVALIGLTACNDPGFVSREAGYLVDEGGFGNATMQNTMVMMGEWDATMALGNRFAQEVPTTINFAFNSSQLTDEARAVLKQQASFIRQFPEVRFRVYGHTDLVGSNSYNKALGMRRAQAAVAYLAAQGIGTARLEAVVSYGKTQPVIATPGPEERNRRTVTEVTGFVKGNPTVMNGKYAEIVWRTYVNRQMTTSLAERPHPKNTIVITQVDPSAGN